ncbi:acyl carrier protein [Paenibacillus kobensis]|uniref:acyl carrier protein n=1 Tax=Paenibacillus kobensis TaxID=59841 RepID=UPI0013E37957|nr:acyl carrier protein [Paenibacillus kobensis]
MSEQLKSQLHTLVGEIIEVDDFASDAHLSEELSIDSMMLIEIVARIEQRYQVKVAEELLPQMTSVDAIYSVVSGLLSGESEAAAGASE